MKKPEQQVSINGDQGQVAAHITSLKNSPGWKLICQVLDENIKEIERIILDGDETMEKDELQKWRDRRYYQIKLKNTPDFILSKIEEGTQVKEIQLDPYR